MYVDWLDSIAGHAFYSRTIIGIYKFYITDRIRKINSERGYWCNVIRCVVKYHNYLVPFIVHFFLSTTVRFILSEFAAILLIYSLKLI